MLECSIEKIKRVFTYMTRQMVWITDRKQYNLFSSLIPATFNFFFRTLRKGYHGWRGVEGGGRGRENCSRARGELAVCSMERGLEVGAVQGRGEGGRGIQTYILNKISWGWFSSITAGKQRISAMKISLLYSQVTRKLKNTETYEQVNKTLWRYVEKW